MQPPAARALAMKLVTNCDLLRLKVIARLHGRSLPPDLSWADLLQEAFARVLDGPGDSGRGADRRVPGGRHAQHQGRALAAPGVRATQQQPVLATEYQVVAAETAEACDPQPDPERWLIAAQQLQAIGTLFAHDPVALQIIAGLGMASPPRRSGAPWG